MAICLDPRSVATHNGRIANEPLGMRIRERTPLSESGLIYNPAFLLQSPSSTVRWTWCQSGCPFTRHRVISAGSKISSRLPN